MTIPRRFWWWGALAALVAAAIPVSCWYSAWRLEHRQDTVIAAAAARYGVDPALVKAVVWQESGFHPLVRGRAGEIGLMQLMDPAAQEWADAERCYPLPERHLFHPGTNTLAGTWYLRKLLRRYPRADNPVPYALADYNAGRANVLKWAQGAAATNSALFVQQIGFPSTRAYVRAVLERRRRYWGEFPASRRWTETQAVRSKQRESGLVPSDSP